MIGKIYTTVFKYYDRALKQMSLKNRPILIIGKADKDDYIVLPISSVTIRKNVDQNFDICIIPNNFPNIKLKKISYIRTHKPSTLHQGELIKEICDLKKEYPELFFEIMSKVNEFNSMIINNYLESF